MECKLPQRKSEEPMIGPVTSRKLSGDVMRAVIALNMAMRNAAEQGLIVEPGVITRTETVDDFEFTYDVISVRVCEHVIPD